MPGVTIAAALLLAVLTPLTIVLVRHEIRLRRIRLVDAFRQNFDAVEPPDPPAHPPADAPKVVEMPGARDPADKALDPTDSRVPDDRPPALAGAPDPADKVVGMPAARDVAGRPGSAPGSHPRTIRSTPSFEYVLSKYAVDLDACPEGIDRRKLRALDLADPAVDGYISGLRWYQLRSNWRILWASVPYMVCCHFGFLIAFWPLSPEGLQSMAAIVAPILPTNGGLAEGAGSAPYGQHFRNVLTIAAIGFMGAYLFTLRTFVRAVTVFDLNAITMLRATVHVLLSVAGVVLIYRALPSTGTLLELVPFREAAADAAPAAAAIPSLWFIAAFLFGFFPDSALRFMLSKATQLFAAIKTTDDRFVKQTRSIPLDVIDGIDFATRFRLEEANVFEVQNLACANPIMLHIETPYGIYQTIDWVAQAQLCAVVGPERFLVMRQFHIRTIFDLERAVLSRHTTPDLRRFVALLLLMPTEVAKTLVNDVIKTSFPDGTRTPAGLIDFDGLNLATATLFAASQAVPTGRSPDATIEHLVRIIVDDLHVHRLRQIWMAIALRLGGRAASLDPLEEPDFYAQAA